MFNIDWLFKIFLRLLIFTTDTKTFYYQVINLISKY